MSDTEHECLQAGRFSHRSYTCSRPATCVHVCRDKEGKDATVATKLSNLQRKLGRGALSTTATHSFTAVRVCTPFVRKLPPPKIGSHLPDAYAPSIVIAISSRKFLSAPGSGGGDSAKRTETLESFLLVQLRCTHARTIGGG